MLRGAAGVAIADVRRSPGLVESILELHAIADEASYGAGSAGHDLFAAESAYQLAMSGGETLCRDVDPSRARVLPKVHTPRLGITLRSLSHYIALVPDPRVVARWRSIPYARETARHDFNVLLLPWPLDMRPAAFTGVHIPSVVPPQGTGFFDCDFVSPRRESASDVTRAIAAAEGILGEGKVDAIVFPEASLAHGEADRICTANNTLVIAGVRGCPKPATGLTENLCAVRFPDWSRSRAPMGADSDQSKHHRWMLDTGQIQRYGLGARLDPAVRWWEAIQVRERTITFWEIGSRLSLAVLVCEDLARQDPVSATVRAIGPHLLVALLQDGRSSVSDGLGATPPCSPKTRARRC